MVAQHLLMLAGAVLLLRIISPTRRKTAVRLDGLRLRLGSRTHKRIAERLHAPVLQEHSRTLHKIIANPDVQALRMSNRMHRRIVAYHGRAVRLVSLTRQKIAAGAPASP